MDWLSYFVADLSDSIIQYYDIVYDIVFGISKYALHAICTAALQATDWHHR